MLITTPTLKEGFDTLGKIEVGMENPSTETWEDREWEASPSVTLCPASVLTKMVATSHMWVLHTRNVVHGTKELNFNNHVWLVAAIYFF